jgi:hypothetical protein
MVLSKPGLYRKMLYTPRLNLKCDDVKVRLAYVQNEAGRGWVIENLDNDGEQVFHKGKMTYEITDLIFEKYKKVNVTWSRSY